MGGIHIQTPFKKAMLVYCILFLCLHGSAILSEEHNDEEIIDDPIDDVIISELDLDQDTFEYTDLKPNIDIVEISYIKDSETAKILLSLTVKGDIEDCDDFKDLDENSSNFTGRLVQYSILLETSNNTYEMSYIDQNCTINGEETLYMVTNSSLSVIFDSLDSNETYVSLYGYTFEIDIESLTDMYLYMDVAPNDAFFIANAEGPLTGEVGEPLTFIGQYDDLFGVSQGPYTYTWEFNDGTPPTSGETVIHTFHHTGTYTVELTIEDTTNLSATDTTDILITERVNIYDVNFDGVVDITDIYLVWKHRRDTPINPLYDVNSDNHINLLDMWLIWKNRGRVENDGENFHFYDLNGTIHQLRDYRGKVVILNLWATWCSACHYQMIELDEIYDNYSHNDLEILSINVDSTETFSRIQEYIDQCADEGYHLNWIFGRELDDLSKYYPTGSIPSLCIFNKNGTIFWSHIGLTNSSELEEKLNEALDKNLPGMQISYPELPIISHLENQEVKITNFY